MLGICVVYLFPDEESHSLLALSLSHLRELTKDPFRIYGCGLRLSGAQQDRLRESDVALIDLPPFLSPALPSTPIAWTS